MAFPAAHKTLVVLDHSPHFLTGCRQHVDIDVFTKSRAPGFIPLAPITKSLWTCNVEAIMEYARIVYDVFPTDRLISVVTSDKEAQTLTSWSPADQTLQQLMVSFARAGAPDASHDQEECSILHGLSRAVELLCQPTPQQTACLAATQEHGGEAMLNRGRIVCFTALNNENHWHSLEQCLQDTLIEHNKLAASKDELLVIDHLELCMVHLTACGTESAVIHKLRKDVSPMLKTELHVSQSGHHIAARMVGLVMNHYTLASTTVTGIPMKEEQNASSSANYDVELLHPAAAHSDLCVSDGLTVNDKDGVKSTAVTLKWCTPKSNTVELQQCMGAYRITPVEVNSRPSSCLTNFLLNGRAVMLEQPRKTGPRMVSHMLASHGGEIYLHMLATARSSLEDPPSISEGAGGKITDYRITDFGELMKDNRPVPVAGVTGTTDLPITRCKQQLERVTRCWPMVISDSIIFNMLADIEPLPSMVVKAVLDDNDVLQCRKVIYGLVKKESQNDALPVPATGIRGKGPKREEQYRQMWSELEALVRAHSTTSPAHKVVLDCLVDCKRPSATATSKRDDADTQDEDDETTQAWKQLEKFQRLTEREKQDLNETKVTPMASPPPKRHRPSIEFGKSGQSLLSMWTNRLNTMHSQRRSEFTGRIDSTSNKADLYKSLRDENGELHEPRNRGGGGTE